MTGGSETRKEPGTPGPDDGPAGRRWILGLGPLLLIAILIGLSSLLNGPSLNKLAGGIPSKEEVAVENIRLTDGQIIVTARN